MLLSIFFFFIPTYKGKQTNALMPPHLTMNLASVDSERQAIHRSIRIHEDAICDLKSKLNILTPIFRLPAELLSQVFTMLSESEACCLSGDLASHQHRWPRVMLVCKRWRAVAIESAALWTCFKSRFVESDFVVLERARGTLKNVELKSVGWKGSPATLEHSHKIIKKLQEKRGGICSLRLVQWIELDFKLHWDSLLGMTTPRLKILPFYDDSGRMLIPAFIIKTPLLKSNLPRMVDFYISGHAIPWNSSALSNLHSLELSNVPEEGHPSLSALLTILSSCPELKSLKLSKSGPPNRFGDRAAMDPSINLPHLRYIYLDMSDRANANRAGLNLLSYLSLPSGVHIDRKICCGYRPLASLLSPSTRPLNPKIRYFVEPSENSIDISRIDFVGERPCGRAIRFQLMLHHESPDMVINYNTAETLHLDCNFGNAKSIGAPFWRFCSNLPNLKEIVISSHPGVIDGLEITLLHRIRESEERLSGLFPSSHEYQIGFRTLSSIIFDEVTFTGGIIYHLLSMMELRKDYDPNFMRITILNPIGLNADELKDLKEFETEKTVIDLQYGELRTGLY